MNETLPRAVPKPGRSGGNSAHEARRLAAREEALRQAALIDEHVGRVIDAVLHDESFRRLEASWRGLRTVVELADGYARRQAGRVVRGVFILALTVRPDEVWREVKRADDDENTTLFRLVCEGGIEMDGAAPFGLLLWDHEIGPGDFVVPTSATTSLVAYLAEIAARSFAPIVLPASPGLIGLDGGFGDLESKTWKHRKLDSADPTAGAWSSFRGRARGSTTPAAFATVVLPRVLARAPWTMDGNRAGEFVYDEDASAPDGSGRVWGTAVYALAAVVLRSFAETGWPGGASGLPADDGRISGGLVDMFPSVDLATDAALTMPLPQTDGLVTEAVEAELVRHGMAPLCAIRGTRCSAFFRLPTAYAPANFSADAALAARLPHVLVACRIAHCLKIMARRMIGGPDSDPQSIQQRLDHWLGTLSRDHNAGQIDRERFPLCEAEVAVYARPGEPGALQCEIRLQPHFQLDELAVPLHFVTHVVGRGGAAVEDR